MESSHRKKGNSEWHALPATSILARWRHYPRLKICVELQACHPLGSAPLPPPRQAAGMLYAIAGHVDET